MGKTQNKRTERNKTIFKKRRREDIKHFFFNYPLECGKVNFQYFDKAFYGIDYFGNYLGTFTSDSVIRLPGVIPWFIPRTKSEISTVDAFKISKALAYRYRMLIKSILPIYIL